jgi:general secretion pathway protein J
MNSRGFTLIEVLVSMAIFAVIGIMAFGGLNTVIEQSDRTALKIEELKALQFTIRLMTSDFEQLQPRPIRSELGDGHYPALNADARNVYLVEFSRGGWMNPAGMPRGGVQRVAYQLTEEGLLQRLYWPVLDRLLGTEPIRMPLLEDLDTVEIRFMDRGRNWHEVWPPFGVPSTISPWVRPVAIEIAIESQTVGRITRLVEIGG